MNVNLPVFCSEFTILVDVGSPVNFRTDEDNVVRVYSTRTPSAKREKRTFRVRDSRNILEYGEKLVDFFFVKHNGVETEYSVFEAHNDAKPKQ